MFIIFSFLFVSAEVFLLLSNTAEFEHDKPMNVYFTKLNVDAGGKRERERTKKISLIFLMAQLDRRLHT